MSSNLYKNEKEKELYTQTLYLNSNDRIKKEIYKKKIILKNEINKYDISYKINKLSYFDVHKKRYIFFGCGKITLKLSESNNDYINIIFYDSCLQLRLQGFISIKFSSLSLDINKINCVLINKIIVFLYHMDNSGESKYEKIMTNIHIYFSNEEDKNKFIDSFIHI